PSRARPNGSGGKLPESSGSANSANKKPEARASGNPAHGAGTAGRKGKGVISAEWWTPPWRSGTEQDPDAGWDDAQRPTPTASGEPAWRHSTHPGLLSDDAILAPLAAQFGQVRSRDRGRDLAEVFTHQREVDAILDLFPDAFTALDVKFLEPSCGSGNFLAEVLRRKLRLAVKADC